MAEIRLWRGDITTLAVDAIVNAADEWLSGGGGVDLAIHRAAGPGLAAECRRVGRCPTGEARLTGGHALPAARVIHTVGPVWAGGGRGEAGLLGACYDSVVRQADAAGCRSLACPAISTGVFGFPRGRAADIAVATLRRALPRTGLVTVTLVAFDAAAERVLAGALETCA
ncbi:MAG: macro domain-containing protein [Paracoccaceae bacterium]|jgi:O-acetyl-ADP-ribose deacetylase (regulator of RNase III)|nr:macro domain-containing protein [Paracoccaceae bacterium]